MSHPDAPDVSATDLGHGAQKLFAGRMPRSTVDLGDPWAVAELAEDILAGRRRGVTMISTDQTRALARLAYASFLVVAPMVDLILLSDAEGAEKGPAAIKEALGRVVRATRLFQERFTCER